MKIKLGVLLLSAVSMLTQSGMAQADSVTGSLAVFQDQETGGEPYVTRVMVTQDYMRMDYGDDKDDFILLDRKSGRISNVTHENKRIMELDKTPVTIEAPFPIKLEISRRDDADMPSIAGIKPRHHLFSVNGKVCEEVIAVDGLLPDTVKALAEFREVLAGQQAKTLASTPADMVSPCDTGLSIFHPKATLKAGLPIRSWDTQGRQRQLIDMRESTALNPALFELPEGYSPYRL